MQFESKVIIPTHRLIDADSFDKCPSVVQIIEAKKHPFYLIEIKADSFVVYGGNIIKKTPVPDKEETGKMIPKSAEENKPPLPPSKPDKKRRINEYRRQTIASQ